MLTTPAVTGCKNPLLKYIKLHMKITNCLWIFWCYYFLNKAGYPEEYYWISSYTIKLRENLLPQTKGPAYPVIYKRLWDSMSWPCIISDVNKQFWFYHNLTEYIENSIELLIIIQLVLDLWSFCFYSIS